MIPSPRIAFFGTPELCIPILDRLCEAGFSPSLVVTAPDRPVGRKQILTAPAVKEWALSHSLPCLQPEKLDGVFYESLCESEWDVFIVVAYGMIFPERFIELPLHNTLNIHYSLLPRWRGASPVESTILHGDSEAGVSIQRMIYALDAGPIVASSSLLLDGDETSPDLKMILSSVGADLLAETLPLWLNGDITPIEQDNSHATVCKKIKKSDGEVSLDMSGDELWQRYRAYYGWPGIFFFTPSGKRIKITEASFNPETHEFTPILVIPEGKSEIPYEQFLESSHE